MNTPKQFGTLNELTEYLEGQEERIAQLETEIKGLKNSINDVAGANRKITLFIDKDLPKTGLLSKHFLDRAFTVWGHYFVAQLIISLILLLAYFLIFASILNTLIR